MTATLPRPPSETDETIEGGVIEDARERQRRHRLRGAAILAGAAGAVALLTGVFGGGGSGAVRSSRNHPSNGAATEQPSRAGSLAAGVPAVAEFGLLAQGVGWVSNGSGVYVTRTGGRTWERVKAIGADAELSGASSAGPGQLALSLADGGQVHQACSSAHGNCESMAAASPGTSSSQRGQIVVTGDAGRTWRSGGFTGHAIPASASFVSSRTGFVLGYTPVAHHDPRASLYETRDGTRTWSRIAAVPFTGLLSFANGRHGLGGGWAMGAGLVDSAAIYRTSDGGRSWTRTSLCRSATVYACEAPHLFAGGRGVVLATARDRRSGSTEVDVYTTANDGVSWTRHTLPHTPVLTDDPIYIPFSAPNADDLFAWVSPYLYTSVDGGATWSRRDEPALTQRGVQPALGNIAFIDRDYGWYADAALFLYTTDGGRRWTEIGR